MAYEMLTSSIFGKGDGEKVEGLQVTHLNIPFVVSFFSPANTNPFGSHFLCVLNGSSIQAAVTGAAAGLIAQAVTTPVRFLSLFLSYLNRLILIIILLILYVALTLTHYSIDRFTNVLLYFRSLLAHTPS